MSKSTFYSVLLIMVSSCTKVLHKEDISIGRIEDPEQLQSAVTGVYGRMNEMLYSNHSVAGSFYYTPNIKGDDMNYGPAEYSPYYDWSDNCYNIPTDNNNVLDPNWQKLYNTIGSANNILIQYDLSSVKDAATRELLGEICMIRAYCYFRLTRTFGQVPLISDININYSVTKASFTEIYSFIEKDLKTAIALLPENNNVARVPYVTPNRGSAKALLAEVYLSWAGYPIKDESKYALAAKEAGEVVDSADFFGFRLMDDFAWLWDKTHLQNSESEFSLYCTNPTPDPQHWWIWHGFYYGEPFAEFMIAPGTTASPFFYVPEVQFFNNYPEEYRKEITFFQTIFISHYNYDSTGTLISADSEYVHISQEDPCGRVAYRKFYYDPDTPQYNDWAGETYFMGIPRVYLLRYAQTVLTCAEAMARSGQLNARAYECVNEIRRRAHHVDLYSPSGYDLQPGLSPEAFADSVVWERARELCGEPEGRWFDLVRLEEVEDLPNLRIQDETGPPAYPITKEDYFSPIPPGEIDFNPNLGK